MRGLFPRREPLIRRFAPPSPTRGEGKNLNLIQRNDARTIRAHLGAITAPQGSRVMTVQEQPYPVVSLMIDTFGEWLKHRRELKEMREMDAANFDRIAGELRMSSADLEALVRQGPHAADELPKMLTALGIDQEDL